MTTPAMSDVPRLASVAAGSLTDLSKSIETEHFEKPGGEGTDPSAPANDVPVSAFADWTTSRVMRTFWRLLLVNFAVSVGAIYVGYGLSVTGSIIANPGFIQQFGTINTPRGVVLDAFHIAMWGGLFFVAQTAAQAGSPLLADRFGRKACMYLLTLFMLIAIILEIFAKNWVVFLIAKILSGFASALTGVALMTYLSEISMPQMRATTLGAFALFFAIGQFGVAIALQVIFKLYPLEFRRAFYSQFAVFGLFLPVAILVPESPVWLCSKGRHDQAMKSLRRLVGSVEGYDVEHEYAVIRHEYELSVDLSRLHGNSDWAAIFKWANFKRVIAATLPFSYQNFCGVPLVFGFSSYFFALAGLEDPFLGTLIISIILLVFIGVSFYTVERFGRRTTILWAGLALAAVNIAIGAASFAPPSAAFGGALIALCSIWVAIYALSLGPLGWSSLVEVSSPSLRAKTAAFAMVIQSLSNILFSYTVPFMLDPQYAGWGTKIGFLFGGLSILFWIPCYYLFPETKSRSYKEIDELYASGIPVRHFANHQLSSVQQGVA